MSDFWFGFAFGCTVMFAPLLIYMWVSNMASNAAHAYIEHLTKSREALMDELADRYDDIASLQDEMRDAVAQAKDCGFEAGKRGGWF